MLVATQTSAAQDLQKLALNSDLYAILEVQITSTHMEIREAYRRLAKALHPDSRATGKKGEERFKQVNEAYRILGDPSKRSQYDQLRIASRKSGIADITRRHVIIASIALLVSSITGIATALMWFNGVDIRISERAITEVSQSTSGVADPAATEIAETQKRADNAAWATAKRKVTKLALRKYLTNYPNGRYTSQAKLKLTKVEVLEARRQADDAVWARAEQKGTKAALTGYLANYPDGRHALAAIEKNTFVEAVEKQLAKDDASWAAANRKRTNDAYKTYLRTHPNGRYVQQAQRLLIEKKVSIAARSKVKPAKVEGRTLTSASLTSRKPSDQNRPATYQLFSKPKIGDR